MRGVRSRASGRAILRLLAVPVVLVAGVRCAHVEAPSGGPVDTTPPAVAAVYPAPSATGVPAEARMIFQFTEWIDRGASRGTVLISPPYTGRARVTVDGDRLVVQPPAGQTLRPRTTHTVTVLGSLKDLRGNPMGPVFDLRFSTGPTLDSAGLDGALTRADAVPARGPLIAALYTAGAARTPASVLPLSPRDTGFAVAARPEPWRELPAALAGSDSAGSFRLAGAAPGDYALFAFEDVNGNFAFDLGLEAAAVGEAALAARPRAAAQALRLVPLDTLPLRVAEVSFAPDSLESSAPGAAPGVNTPGTLVVSFTRAPHPVRATEAARYAVIPAAPDSGAAVAVTAASWDLARGVWVLDVPPLRPGRWRLALQARPDFPGRPGADAPDTSVSFEVTARAAATDTASPLDPDRDWTLAPRLAGRGPDGLPQAAPSLAPGARAVFTSSLPLSPARWARLSARAEARANRLDAKVRGRNAPAAPGDDTLRAVPHRLERLDAWSFAVQLGTALRPGHSFELRLLPPAGDSSPPRVLFADAVPDSAAARPGKFLPPADRRDRLYWARAVGASTAGGRVTAFPLQKGAAGGDTLVTAPVPPGRYLVHGFQDRDRDGVWNPGSLRPWTAQEPYDIMTDTLVVGESRND